MLKKAMDPAQTPTPTHPDRPFHILQFVAASVVIFGLGFGGSITLYNRFNPAPTPPAPTRQLLGISTEESTPAPSPEPTPDLSLSPETLKKPYSGTIAYIQNDQIYTIQADRSHPTQISQDATLKTNLVASPDHLSLAYTFQESEASDTPLYGLNLINTQTKKITEIIKPQTSIYTHLAFSPSGQYLSVWNHDGQEALVFNLLSNQEILRYSTKNQTGISPIVWLSGSDTLSFILDNELFTVSPSGEDLKSLAKNVVGIKTTGSDQDIPTPPTWSLNDRYVAFIRPKGIYILDLVTNQETTVTEAEKEFALDQIPYQLIAFNNPVSHLLFVAPPDKDNRTSFAYSLSEHKTVPIETYGPSNLMDTANNQLLGLVNRDAGSHLARYSLDKWSTSTCDQTVVNFPTPTHPSLLNSQNQALISLTHSNGITLLSLIDSNTCTTYDLIKTNNPLNSPIWLSD